MITRRCSDINSLPVSSEVGVPEIDIDFVSGEIALVAECESDTRSERQLVVASAKVPPKQAPHSHRENGTADQDNPLLWERILDRNC